MSEEQDISDAAKILDRRHPPNAVDLLARITIRQDIEIAEMIYQACTESGLSQRELAKLVGTSASVICRLEDADYEGHTLAMLRRVAAALGQRIELHFVPDDKRRRESA